jgi:phage replication initiation protein
MGGKSVYSVVPSHVAFVDQVSFTAKCAHVPGFWLTDHDFATLLSPILEEIFGFGVTSDRERGMNFYNSSFVLGDRWGFVCVGGQMDTFLVQLTGQGAIASRAGWEKRLHAFLSSIPSARITRVDLAHDDYSGKSYSPLQARDDYIAGKFTTKGRPPSCRQDGNWIFPDGSGLTFYVGKRENGKVLRVYEKGKQLAGSSDSPYPDWVRVEIELHNEGRSIPFDVLTNPGPYLAGSYPALEFLADESCRIATKQKALQVAFDSCTKMVKKQVGRYINAMMQVYGDSQKVVDMITRPGIPDRLIMPDWSESPPPLTPSPKISVDLAFDLAFSQ